MLLHLSAFASFLLIVLLIVYTRTNLLPRIPERYTSYLPSFLTRNQYSRLSTFESQAEAGLSSANFDLEQNIFGDDSRAGLDEQGTAEIHEIMRRQNVSFDQARLIRHQRILARNGIDPSGMPLDNKAVTRL